MHIRKAGPQDLEILSDFSCQLCLETEGRCLDRDKATAGIRTILVHPSWFILVAEDQSEVIGEVSIAGSEWCEWSNGLFWWATSLYVTPPHRGKGVTRLLLHELDSYARASHDGVIGIRGASLATNHQAHEALAKSGRRPNGYIVIENRFDRTTPSHQPGG
jgi:GNAT superfamily N-acetyltransferase